jgi:hypothetical protein
MVLPQRHRFHIIQVIYLRQILIKQQHYTCGGNGRLPLNRFPQITFHLPPSCGTRLDLTTFVNTHAYGVRYGNRTLSSTGTRCLLKWSSMFTCSKGIHSTITALPRMCFVPVSNRRTGPNLHLVPRISQHLQRSKINCSHCGRIFKTLTPTPTPASAPSTNTESVPGWSNWAGTVVLGPLLLVLLVRKLESGRIRGAVGGWWGCGVERHIFN